MSGRSRGPSRVNCSAMAPRRPPTTAAALLVAVLAIIAACAGAAPAAELNGPAEVIDGNSLAIGGRAVRLFGIEAPDEQQVCRRGGADWRCGQDAGWALAAKIERHWVLCDTQAAAGSGSQTAADQVSAVCYLDGRRIDLNAWMVAQGWALADRRSATYLPQEQAAQRAGRGLWSGTFEPPWEWRQQHH